MSKPTLRGLFSPSELTLIKPPPSLIPRCGECGLYKLCKSPKMKLSGHGERGVLVIGQSPGKDEDLQGKPFVGVSGQRLKSTLRKLGVDLIRDCWVTNSIICRPKLRQKFDDRWIEHCRPNLLNTLKELKDKIKVVILLGGEAVKALIGHIWKEDPGGINRWVGWNIPYQRGNYWICSAYHPSYLLREENPVLDLYFEKHLEEAFSHTSRPWEVVPDYKSQVELVLDDKKASAIIRRMVSKGGPVSWDLETNTLKPDSSHSEIVCCSLSWRGKKTIAFPWYGEAIVAMKEFLVSEVPKIAANCKFEHRWALAKLGIEVKNWFFDTMLAAHALDNRKNISGLKFQAFVNLGQESYNDHIEPYLSSMEPGSNSLNRIKEIDLTSLLTYCGMDSLLEYKVCEIQAKKLGIVL